jgi:hypothetical protein
MSRKYFIILMFLVPILGCYLRSCGNGNVLEISGASNFSLKWGQQRTFTDFGLQHVYWINDDSPLSPQDPTVFLFTLNVFTGRGGTLTFTRGATTIVQSSPTSFTVRGTKEQLNTLIKTIVYTAPRTGASDAIRLRTEMVTQTITRYFYKAVEHFVIVTLLVPTPIPTNTPRPTATITPTRTPTPLPRPAVNCAPFRMTSPLDGLPNGLATFYWDAAPGATSYRVNLYNEQGAFVTNFDVNAPTTTVSGDISEGRIGLGARYAWEVVAFFNGRVACTTPRILLFRASYVPPVFVEPIQIIVPRCGNGIQEPGETQDTCPNGY